MSLVPMLIREIISISFMIGAAITIRWILMLSTPTQDWWWLQNSGVWQYLDSLKWYRGTEYLHQLRANKIVNSTIVVQEDIPEE